jgi:uncharacterized membrane protein
LNTRRLEAFTDGVISIMVLELTVPAGGDLSTWSQEAHVPLRPSIT